MFRQHNQSLTDQSYEDNSLELLEQCTWSTKDMPSWVPDWTNTEHYRLFSGRSSYHVTKSSGAIFHFDLSGRSLSCQGFKIDEIDGLGESYFENFGISRPEDAVVQSRRGGTGYRSEDALKEALWSTLVGGRDLRGRKAPVNYQCLLQCSPKEEDEPPGSFSRGRIAFNKLITQSADFIIAGKQLSSYFPSASVASAEDLRNPLEQIFRFARTRRLMVTLDGMLGFVPHDAQQGDSIFVLLGCNVPIILRAVGKGHHKVVGGCYLHGIMEGEAMERLEAGQSHIEEIVLC